MNGKSVPRPAKARRRRAVGIASLVLAALLLGAAGWWAGSMRCGQGAFDVGVSRLAPRKGQADTSPDIRLWYPLARAPRTVFDALRFAPADAVADAPLASSDRPFPVLLHFSGWPETVVQNRRLIDALVGRGYVVVTVSYPAAASHTAPSTLMDFSSATAYRESLDRADAHVRAHARDASAVLDALAVLDAGAVPGRFAGRLDLGHVGILGYSLGGAVAAQAANRDARFKAVVNLDGWQFAEAAREGVAQPYLIVSDEALPTPAELASATPEIRYRARLTQEDYERSQANFARHGGYLLMLSDAAHADLGGTPASWTRALLHRHGAERTERLVEAYVSAFYGQYLRDQQEPLLGGAGLRQAGVRLRRWPGPTCAAERSSEACFATGRQATTQPSPETKRPP